MTTTPRNRVPVSTRTSLARIVGELADLASYKDIGAALILMRDAASTLGIDPEDVPGYSELLAL